MFSGHLELNQSMLSCCESVLTSHCAPSTYLGLGCGVMGQPHVYLTTVKLTGIAQAWDSAWDPRLRPWVGKNKKLQDELA